VTGAVTAPGPITIPPHRASHVPALYFADVTHTRRHPIANRFRHQVSYWLVDYDQLPQPGGIVGRLARVEHRDHADIRTFLAKHGLHADRIRMLTMARTLGFVFNPISVFWCDDSEGERVAVLVEVHNTYGGRHLYLLPAGQKGRIELDKVLYVSPFYPVDGRYEIRVSDPDASISVAVTLHRKDGAPFVATLRGQQCAVTTRNVVRASLGHSAFRVACLIRWHAIRLWLRGLKVHPR